MDPLSIGAAVAGLITAATRIGSLVHHFVTHTRDAPKSASQILDEMNSVTSALERLQVYLTGAKSTDVARRSLVSLRNIIATLTACVTTYSDLEKVVGNCTETGKVARVKWLFHESEILELFQRIQAHKSSLMLMLTILQCESMQEAEASMDRLIDLVEDLVASNTDLRARIDMLAEQHESSAPTIQTISCEVIPSAMPSPDHEFEQDLNTSRVYRKLRPRDSLWSINSSQQRSMALSAFSELTLNDVSIISVLYLPVWSIDLTNTSYYHFGADDIPTTGTDFSFSFLKVDVAFPGGFSTGPLYFREPLLFVHLYEKVQSKGMRFAECAELELCYSLTLFGAVHMIRNDFDFVLAAERSPSGLYLFARPKQGSPKKSTQDIGYTELEPDSKGTTLTH